MGPTRLLPLLTLSLALACGGDLATVDGSGTATDEAPSDAPSAERGERAAAEKPAAPPVEIVARGLGTPSALAVVGRSTLIATRDCFIQGSRVATGALFLVEADGHPPLKIYVDPRGAAVVALSEAGGEIALATSDGRVLALPARGGEARTLAELGAPIRALASEGSRVVALTDGGALHVIDRDGTGSLAPVATGLTQATGLRIQGASAFVLANGARATLARVSLESGAVEQVASRDGSACGLASAGHRLAWTASLGTASALVELDLRTSETAAAERPELSCAIASDEGGTFALTRAHGKSDAELLGRLAGASALAPIAPAGAALGEPGTLVLSSTSVSWATHDAVLRVAR